MFSFNPITIKRFRRFKSRKRAWWSFLALVSMYILSLGAELLCNGVPIIVRHRGRTFFPVFKFYPDDAFTGSGLNTRTDYRALESSLAFREADSWMVWPPLSTGPNDIASPAELAGQLRVFCRLEPVRQVCGLSIDAAGKITRFQGEESVWGTVAMGRPLSDLWSVPDTLSAAVAARFANRESPAVQFACKGIDGFPDAVLALTAFSPRHRPLRQVRIMARTEDTGMQPAHWSFAVDGDIPLGNQDAFRSLPEETRATLLGALRKCESDGGLQSGTIVVSGVPCQWSVERESVRFPFRPVAGHLFGLDDAGRDVLARLIYAFRTSLSFGLFLVVSSMGIGAALGLAQGYAGGWTDLCCQRLIEIWSALPFLYVVILLGSVYGPGFWLMLFCYALFNWIGISYYMRAEMLRLRKQPFVEAAKCLGLPSRRIVLRHVLPNALVPIITFFPFSLVGAIGSLAALDYLGFGLPPPTPSIGQLLQQAQSQRWAWWLILYPSLTLFTIMLLGVFVGEGVRDAFDPRRQGRIES